MQYGWEMYIKLCQENPKRNDCLGDVNLNWRKILWNIDQLLGNGSVNTLATYVHATIERRSSLCNGEVNSPDILGKGVFDSVRMIATWWNNRTGKCCVCGLCRDVISTTVWSNEESRDLLSKACTDRGLVCSAKGRIFSKMLSSWSETIVTSCIEVQ
jgi:hypothetical protein